MPSIRFRGAAWGPHPGPRRAVPVDSLRRKRLRQLLGVPLVVTLLGGLITLSVLRPDPREREASAFTQSVLAREPGALTAAERDELRDQWERFSPETRRRVFQEVARDRLERMREQTRDLTPEQRREQIDEALRQMRQRRERWSEQQRIRVRERLATPEGREMVRNAVKFYQAELTSRERAEMDPLVHEWVYQLEHAIR